jgi:hypothetical protein
VPVRPIQEERSALSVDAERALLCRSHRSRPISYDRTPAALQHPWTRPMAISLVVQNPASQLSIKKLKSPHGGEYGRCIALARSQVSPKERAGDNGRGGATAPRGLSLHVYCDPSANRTRACTDQARPLSLSAERHEGGRLIPTDAVVESRWRPVKLG